MLTLYHGSQVSVRNAEAVLNTFQFDMDQAVADGVRIKSFPAYDLEWLDYVVACRRGKDYSNEYDIHC